MTVMKRGFMGGKISWDSNPKDKVSVLGLYSEFQSLRAGARQLRHIGFGIHEISYLFAEAALSLTTQNDSRRAVFPSESGVRCPLIGGTLESLRYIRTRASGVIAGAIASLGLPTYDAEQYENGILAGKLLICARSFSCALGDFAMQALLDTGGECVMAVPQGAARSRLVPGNDFSWSDVKLFFEANLVC